MMDEVVPFPSFEWKRTETTHMSSRLIRLGHCGRVPLIWLAFKYLQGIDECGWQEEEAKAAPYRDVRFGSSRSGREPIKLLVRRPMPVTLLKVASQTTPYQEAEQGSVAVFQLSFFVH